jgi:hypothetical protein
MATSLFADVLQIEEPYFIAREPGNGAGGGGGKFRT